MKTIKPQKLGVLHRTFENDGRCYFVPTVLLFFSFDAPAVPLHEVKLWKLVADELGVEGALDEGMWKVRGEVLVTGRAYAKGGKPATACAVRLALGPIDKKLYVVGDRYWKGGTASDPKPFREMRVSWARAFGGEGFEDNPRGRGYGPSVDGDTGVEIHWLPNVEDPNDPVTSPEDRPAPVGFGPIELTRPARLDQSGTYDRAWLEERYPGFAEDLRWEFFNTAPADQWLDGYFAGDETFVVEGMHPEQPVLRSQLPGLVARCFITRDRGPSAEADDEHSERADDEERYAEFREVPLRIDTVHLFPHRQRGIVVYRGVTVVAEDDAADIQHLIVACERPAEPKPRSHYRTVLRQRLDPDKGYLHALRDGDLMPERDPDEPVVDDETLGDTEQHGKLDNLVAANMRRRMDAELQKGREQIAALGLDPDELGVPDELPPPEEPPDLERLPEYVEEQLARAEQAQADLERQRDELMADARRRCEEAGLDFDAIHAAAVDQQGGPPTFSADAELERINAFVELGRNAGMPIPEAEAKLADPELRSKLEGLERSLKEMYRRFAQHFPAAARLGGDEAARVRASVEAALAAGESLAERDLTGADLAGLNLHGVDLQRAFLESADLSDANLSGADLTDAVLARADLSGASLVDAKVLRTNFGGARLHGTDLGGGLDLSGAVFGGTDLSGADLSGATLDGADFMEAVLRDAKLVGAKGARINFFRNDLAGAKLGGCAFEECNFYEVDLTGADLTGATLRSSTFATTKADGAKLDAASCENLRVVADSSFVGATFRKATLTRANLRGTDLGGADFSGARLDQADLSEANLAGATFYRAKGPQALLMKSNLRKANLTSADLLEAVLQKAVIRGADFKGANLFRADFAKVDGDRRTSFDDANMKHIRFVKRPEEA